MAKRKNTRLKAARSVRRGSLKDTTNVPLVRSPSSDQSRSGNTKGLVPVVDSNNNPLFPCKITIARKLVRDGKATPFFKKGIFCIRINKEVPNPSKKKIVFAVDPGSKRTGITVAAVGKVVLNIQCDTPYWIKKKMEVRKALRRSRRNRNTPYRQCRSNRTIGGIPHSTKARWDTNLRILDQVRKVVPVTRVVVEDIAAVSKKGQRRWNKNFSPLEVGKSYFEEEIKSRNLKFYKFAGYETKEQRDKRGFKKSSSKLSNKWEAHCVDSHCLSELVLGKIEPVKDMYVLSLIKFHRRNLHLQNFTKGGIRRKYGSTRSRKINRGTLVEHPKYGRCTVGGNSNKRISLHSLETGKRLFCYAKKKDLKILTNLKWRAAFLPGLKAGVSSCKV